MKKSRVNTKFILRVVSAGDPLPRSPIEIACQQIQLINVFFIGTPCFLMVVDFHMHLVGFGFTEVEEHCH